MAGGLTLLKLTARLAVTIPVVGLLYASPVLAATPPSLGSAGSFALLGGPAVSCTDSFVTGDVGVGLTDSFTNTNCTIAGTVHPGDPVAVQAYSDFLVAYDEFATTPCDTTLTGTLADVTLTPGAYCFDAAATLTGLLTLDGQGNANAVWIFKIGTGGTGALTGTDFSVIMADGAQACNTYWWVAEGATMTTSDFQGTILAGAGITVTGGTFTGRALAKEEVTLTGPSVSVCTVDQRALRAATKK